MRLVYQMGDTRKGTWESSLRAVATSAVMLLRFLTMAIAQHVIIQSIRW